MISDPVPTTAVPSTPTGKQIQTKMSTSVPRASPGFRTPRQETTVNLGTAWQDLETPKNSMTKSRQEMPTLGPLTPRQEAREKVRAAWQLPATPTTSRTGPVTPQKIMKNVPQADVRKVPDDSTVRQLISLN
ncbi:hypothetical protein FOCC_FOCC000313, partial [Frankliniella occidentalis]